MHCLLKWIGTEQSKNCCPMDRRTWGTLLVASLRECSFDRDAQLQRSRSRSRRSRPRTTAWSNRFITRIVRCPRQPMRGIARSSHLTAHRYPCITPFVLTQARPHTVYYHSSSIAVAHCMSSLPSESSCFQRPGRARSDLFSRLAMDYKASHTRYDVSMCAFAAVRRVIWAHSLAQVA